MPATTMNAELLPGETLTLVGPGKVEFQAAQAAKAVTGAKAAGTAGQGIVATNVQTTVGGVTKTGAAAAAAKAGTIWTGKGLSLGLGLGLGAWGPGILAAAAIGGYIYYRKKKTLRLWPF
ncbi:MAG: magnetic particle specific iron-binding protein [Magnetococcales bacterium]|nr:magnetic particle specific iron-binding protein [Magnetococcales bacterium]